MPGTLELDIDGKLYKFGSVGMMIEVLAERELRRSRLEQFQKMATIAKDATPEIAGRALAEAYRDYSNSSIILRQELAAFMESATGRVFHFKQSAKIYNPQITDEESEAAYGKLTIEQWRQLDGFWTSSLTNGNKSAQE
jgi:hypothetical protein